MKNILVVSHGAALGGSPISALNISRFIDKSKFKIIYVFGEEGKIAKLAKDEGNEVFIAKKRGLFSLPLIFDFIKIIRLKQIDLIHLNTLTSYYKYPAIAAKLLKKPLAWFVREDPTQKRCIKLAPYLNKFSNKVITVSYDTAQNLRHIDKNLITTIHNGIDLNSYNSSLDPSLCCLKLALDPKFNYITTVASLEPRKGILELVEAFGMISSELEGFKLLIVGADRSATKSYLNLLKDKIAALKLQDKVVLFGESVMINEIMCASKIFVLCSYWEGLSRVLLEAMSCSKAIVATADGGNKEQVIDGVNGYTINAGDIDELAKKIKLCLSDERKITEFQNASRRLAQEKFDIKVTTKKIELLYTDMLKV